MNNLLRSRHCRQRKDSGHVANQLEDCKWRQTFPHTTILWLKHRLQDIATIWNHPQSGLPAGTMPSKNWHIRLKRLWHQWRPSTRTVAENPDAIAPKYLHRPCVIISGDEHCVPDDRIEAPPRIASGVLQGFLWVMVQRISFINLPHTGIPYIECSPNTALASVPVPYGTSLIAI